MPDEGTVAADHGHEHSDLFCDFCCDVAARTAHTDSETVHNALQRVDEGLTASAVAGAEISSLDLSSLFDLVQQIIEQILAAFEQCPRAKMVKGARLSLANRLAARRVRNKAEKVAHDYAQSTPASRFGHWRGEAHAIANNCMECCQKMSEDEVGRLYDDASKPVYDLI